MRSLVSWLFAQIGLTLFSLPAAEPNSFTVPVIYYKLPNGLRVVLSPDSTAPTVVTAVYYRIGFRVEPKDRPDAVISQLRFVDYQGLDRSYLSTYVQKVNAVKPSDIQRVSESYIIPLKPYE